MLKVNLLEGKDIPFAEEKPEIKESEFLSAEDLVAEEEKNEMVEQEPVEKPAQPPVEENRVGGMAEEPEPVAAEKEHVAEPAEEREFTFQKKSKFPIVSVVVILALVLIALAYFRIFSNKKAGPAPVKEAIEKTAKKEPKMAPKKPSATNKATPGAAKMSKRPIVSPTAPSIKQAAAELSSEEKAGFAAVNLFGKFLEAVPAGAKIAFLSFNSGYFTIELYTPQKEILNAFLKRAKSSVPSLTQKIVSSDIGFYNGKKMRHTLIKGQISISGRTAAAGNVLGWKKAKPTVLALAKTDRVRVREIRESPLVTDEKGKHIPITVKFSGSEENTQKFLTDLLNGYRNVGVSRILISASREGGGNQQDAALDLNLFTE